MRKQRSPDTITTHRKTSTAPHLSVVHGRWGITQHLPVQHSGIDEVVVTSLHAASHLALHVCIGLLPSREVVGDYQNKTRFDTFCVVDLNDNKIKKKAVIHSRALITSSVGLVQLWGSAQHIGKQHMHQGSASHSVSWQSHKFLNHEII